MRFSRGRAPRPAPDVVALTCLGLCYWIGNTMQRPLVAPYALTLGAKPTEIGAILIANALPSFLLAIPTGALADRIGFRPLLYAGLATMLVSGGCLVVSPSVGSLVASQAGIGVGALATWLSMQVAMFAPRSDGETRHSRARRITNLSMLIVIGQLVGPVIGGVLADVWGYRAAFVAYMVTVTGCIVSTFFAAPPRRTYATERRTVRSLSADVFRRSFVQAFHMMRRPGMAMTILASFCALYLLDVRTAFQPLYFHQIGLTPSVIGLLLTTSGFFSLLARPILMPALRRFRSGTILIGCMVPGSMAITGVVLFDGIVPQFALAVVAGTALGVAQALNLIFTADHTSDDDRGLGISLRMVGNRLSYVVDSLVFGFLLIVVGLVSAFMVTGALMILLTVVAGVVLARKPTRASE